MKKSYSELMEIPNYLDRYLYLKFSGVVGSETFGFSRYLNQAFYQSYEWKKLREEIIIRDAGCDLAHSDYPINGRILIHHLNPITLEDINNRSDSILDPENLICVAFETHNAIHYGDESKLFISIPQRQKNDTIPWR